MEIEVIEKKKGAVELEFEEKELPEVLRAEIAKKEIDTYTYTPHPLISGHRLRVEAKDAVGELRKSLEITKKDWEEFESLIMKKI